MYKFMHLSNTKYNYITLNLILYQTFEKSKVFFVHITQTPANK